MMRYTMMGNLWLFCSVLTCNLLYSQGRDVPGRSDYNADDPKHYSHWEYPEQRPADYLSYRKLRLYDHGSTDQWQTAFNKTEHQQGLPFRLPFFGYLYEYINMNSHGFLHFGTQPKNISFPVKFPLKPEDTVQEKDPPLIGIWLGPQSPVRDLNESGFYLRVRYISDSREDWLSRRILDDFSSGMIGAANFRPTFAIIATWRNLTVTNAEFQGTNTYQVVLATDERRTYAMFNYDAISWTAFDDVNQGKYGKQPFIGFNAGNTTRSYELLPYSQSYFINNMTENTFGNDIPGRLFFQVDDEVQPGFCINWDRELSHLSERLRLTIFPRRGPMLGGTMVNVTGPCFSRHLPIYCYWRQHVTSGVYGDQNHASCVMPLQSFNGYIDLRVSVGYEKPIFVGKVYVESPDTMEENVYILANRDKEEDPANLTIRWKSENLVSDQNAPVELRLFGYHETDYDRILMPIDVLKTGFNGDRQFDLNVNRSSNILDSEKLKNTIGLFNINTTDPHGKSHVLWSRPMPLSWYFNKQWPVQHGKDWKDEFCNDWYRRESKLSSFTTSLWQCPCTLSQARLDVGRFAPDKDCNTFNRRCDPLHKGALHCVTTGRPSSTGSGQTCCYDIEGELMLNADTMYGGRPSREFSEGVLPYQQKLPALSHWYNDVAPFFYCCHWQKEKEDSESCQKFRTLRRSSDCTTYEPPAHAAVYGDPHLMTFDSVNYTFNGAGEFTLVNVSQPKLKMTIQGRFEIPKRTQNSDLVVNGTYLTAVAVRENISATVEFVMKPKHKGNSQMYVIVDREFVHFTEDADRTQHFKGVTLYAPHGIYNMSKIIAMFDSGAGLEVSVYNGQLVLNVYLPTTFKSVTKGLLGFYDGNPENDFLRRDYHDFVPINATSEVIFEEFGNEYRLAEYESLFSHELVGYHFAHYDRKEWRPNFGNPPNIPENFPFSNRQVLQTCSNSKSCIFDFIATWNRDYARTTKDVEGLVQQLHHDIGRKEIRCPPLDKPANGFKSTVRTHPGSSVMFSCENGLQLVGTQTRNCTEFGQWTEGSAPRCVVENDTTTDPSVKTDPPTDPSVKTDPPNPAPWKVRKETKLTISSQSKSGYFFFNRSEVLFTNTTDKELRETFINRTLLTLK